MKSYENLKAKSVSLDKVRDYWKGKNIPKSMIRINNKFIFEYILENLHKAK
ncbi:hypothetical protein IDG80_02165, partial [Pelagibacterales bacterium SAG-MED24]|nr:hypothetical protein [Pelagibacterales bacterium SAG-MED24]